MPANIKELNKALHNDKRINLSIGHKHSKCVQTIDQISKIHLKKTNRLKRKNL